MMPAIQETTPAKVNHHSIPLLRLLWKEFRERRGWAICWTLTILAVSLLAHGQQFCGDIGWMSTPWHYLPIIFAGLVGMGEYNSELKRGRAFFLFTRAVKWRNVLFAKVLFGTIIIIGTPLLAAGIFYFTCPEPYFHLTTLPNILVGVGLLVWPSMLCYLCGLACSVILPGLAGETLTVTSVALSILLTLVGSVFVEWLFYYFKFFTDMTMRISLIIFGVNVGILLFAIPGIFWGGLTAVCSGLFNNYQQRIKLFVPKLIVSMLIGGFLSLCLPQSLAERLFLRWYPDDSGIISTGGSYAILSYTQQYTVCGIDIRGLGITGMIDSRKDVIRLADHTVLRRITSKTPQDVLVAYAWSWVSDSVAVGRSVENNSNKTVLYHPETGKIIPLATNNIVNGTLSPNGHILIDMSAKRENEQQPFVWHLYFYDLENGRVKDVILPIGNHSSSCSAWWVTNDIVGYYFHQDHYKINAKTHRKIFDFSNDEVHYLHLPKF